MPGSFLNFDEVVKLLVSEINPNKLLDIGCGNGKYGEMIKSMAPSCHRTGIEIEPSYVDQFNLNEVYDELRIGDAWSMLRDNHSEFHDLCIIGDCIEHMPKSVGIDLINYLTYRTGYVIILAPEFAVQGAVNGIDAESHISVWSERDFTWHDRWAWDNCFTISLFLLRGYQKANVDLSDLVDRVNSSGVMVKDFYGENELRAVELKMQFSEHIDAINGKNHSFRIR
jgi:hypothetical protein